MTTREHVIRWDKTLPANDGASEWRSADGHANTLKRYLAVLRILRHEGNSLPGSSCLYVHAGSCDRLAYGTMA